MKTLILICSVALNICLGAVLLNVELEGCAEMANGKIGVLSRDIEVGVFNTDKALFTLPKGLVVRDASATGAGWFEPYRFRIVVTSNDEGLVDYGATASPVSGKDSEYYSAELRK